MADQKRWFKLWCSAPSDDALLKLPPAIRWAWAVLGCYTKQHGTNGRVSISPTNGVLSAQMGVSLLDNPRALIETIVQLPHIYLSDTPMRWPHGIHKDMVCDGRYIRGGICPDMRGGICLEEWCWRNGNIIVTWRNWNKYQEDVTAAVRGLALRSKKRGEESSSTHSSLLTKRLVSTARAPEAAPATAPTNGPIHFRTPDVILDVLRRAPKLGAVPRLASPQFWQAELRANPGVNYPAEILKAEAWLTSHPERPVKKFQAFLHNWLARADRPEA